MYPAPFGQYGTDWFTAGVGAGGSWYAFTALEDATVTMVVSNGGATTTRTAVPVPGGVTLYGKFSSLTAVTGSIWAYKTGNA